MQTMPDWMIPVLERAKKEGYDVAPIPQAQPELAAQQAAQVSMPTNPSQPFQQDPFGPTAKAFQYQDPYQTQMMFAQNPATPDVAPSMGIGPGGEPIGNPAMDFQFSRGADQGQGGNLSKAAGMMAGAQKAFGGVPQAPQAQLGGLPGVGQSNAKPIPVEFALPLLELMRGARGRK